MQDFSIRKWSNGNTAYFFVMGHFAPPSEEQLFDHKYIKLRQFTKFIVDLNSVTVVSREAIDQLARFIEAVRAVGKEIKVACSTVRASYLFTAINMPENADVVENIGDAERALCHAPCTV